MNLVSDAKNQTRHTCTKATTQHLKITKFKLQRIQEVTATDYINVFVSDTNIFRILEVCAGVLCELHLWVHILLANLEYET